jgi:flagellar L-ring protein precursor FlgH
MRNSSLLRLTGLFVVSSALLSACATADKATLLTTPTSIRPKPENLTPANLGSLFPTANTTVSVGFRPLFEDTRARNVGDTLTIVLNETTSAAKNSGALAARKANSTNTYANTGAKPGFLGGAISGVADFLTGVGNNASTTDLKSEGSGNSSNSNYFNGTITVTVIEVLSNGNLVVAGERQIAVSNEEETIRFGGVVNPRNLVNNSISSQQVADARMEYRGRGAADDAQQAGWLTRALLKFNPL